MSLSLDSQLIWRSLIYQAEEMKIALRNAAFSPNIRERMDHSCAVFDEEGELIAQAKAIPVHLGSMVDMLEEVRDRRKMHKGEEIILNDPYTGGTHLPDITLISPVFFEEEKIAYVVNRAHHSDIGGKYPGSMAGDSKEIFEEGLRIPPIKIRKQDRIQQDILDLILLNTRTPKVRKGDILAQLAANKTGRERIQELLQKFDIETFRRAINEIQTYCKERMEDKLSDYPVGTYCATDYLDGFGKHSEPIQIAVKIEKDLEAIRLDFSQSDEEVEGPLNAPYSVTLSAVLFVTKAIFDPNAPSNAGTYQPIKITAPKGTVLHATPPSAVVGGNVETSQRIVDVLLQAVADFAPSQVCAGCQGTMNNVAIGAEKENGKSFTFYETIGGGFGGRKGKDGPDGIHSHMTNTMNTPIEEIERRYPLRVIEYGLREDSSGGGQWRGGLGIIRKIKTFTPARLSLLGERHKFPPYGLFGGKNGERGEYFLHKQSKGKVSLNSKATVELEEGDILSILTPGGGGFGDPEKRDRSAIMADLRDEKISKEHAKKVYSWGTED